MSFEWLLSVVHAAINVTLVALALRDVKRLRGWRVAWDAARSKANRALSAASSKCLTATGPSGLLAELTTDLSRVSDAKSRVAMLNEATTEFESRLGFGRAGAVGWRVCLASGVAWGCLTVVENLSLAVGYLASGGVGAILTWQLGRMADSHARALRERWNGLIRALSRSFPQDETFGDRAPTMQCGADEHD